MRKRAGKTPDSGAARPRRRRKATMKDVADLAGVSLATVSRTLSAAAEVSPRLSRRVQAAARRLDYAVNINARGLRGKTSGLVVVLLPDIANPFFSVLLQGIEEQARSHDMAVLIGDTGVDRAIAETYWRNSSTASAPTASSCSTAFFLFRRGSGRSPTTRWSSSASGSPASTRRSSASTTSPPRSTRSAIWRASAIAASPTSAVRPTTC